MRTKAPRHRLKQLACVAFAACAASAAHAAGPGWDWTLEPYLWGPTIRTNLKTYEPPTEVETETTFPEVVKKLDGALLVRIKGRGDRVGAFVDFIYLGVSQQRPRRIMTVRTDLDTRLMDAAVSWRPGGQRDTGLDLFAGLRYVDIDANARFTPDNPEFQARSLHLDRSFSDFLVGARYAWGFNERWGLTVHADASGGDTDGTWSASAMARYRTQRGAWSFGYRHMEIEVDNAVLDTTVTMTGPQVGYGFRF